MKINKDQLKKALEIVKPGLANKEVIEQSTSFAFIKGRVVTYNDEISVSHPIKDLDLEGAIQADELYKFLAKVKSDEIDITIHDEEIVLKCGRATSGFALMSEVTLPLENEISEKGKWFDIPDKFLEFLTFASMSCSSDMSNPKLVCVHVNEKGFIESSDNFRITHCKLKTELPIATFLIPGTSVNIITKINVTKIAEGKGWIHFKSKEGTIVSCRTFKETYVDTTAFLKPLKKGIHIQLPNSLKDVLDRAIIFAKRSQMIDESIDVDIYDKTLLVKSKSETSWFEETVPIKYDGPSVTFAVTPYLLKDIITQTNECVLTGNMLNFKGEDWIYITMLRNVIAK